MMKNYIANLSQTGTSAPTAVEFQNTIGAVTFARIDAGTYTLNCVGAFPEGKVHILAYGWTDDYSEAISTVARNGDDEIIIYTRGFDNPPVLLDGTMGNLSVCITVFD